MWRLYYLVVKKFVKIIICDNLGRRFCEYRVGSFRGRDLGNRVLVVCIGRS